MKVLLGIALICLAACVTTARVQAPVCEPGVDYYPHPTDCNLYYQCSGGVPIQQACPPGLYWDAVEEVCDFPEFSGCDDTAQTTTQRPTTTTQTATTTYPQTTTEQSITTSKVSTTGLPTESPTSTSLPTEGPTTTGLPTEGPTTTGLPTEGTTTSAIPTEGTTTTAIPTEGTTTSPIPTEGTTTSPIPTEGTTTSAIPTEGTTTSAIPTEGPSTTGIPTEGTSAVPTEPPPTEPSSTTLATSPQPSTEPPGGLPESCPPVDDPDTVVRLPHETNCEYYYRCTNGTGTLYACASDSSQHFSPTLRVCQPVDVAGCDRCPAVDDAAHVVRLPHETDCHLYYLCQEGVRNLYQCREDWHFSRNIRDCLEQAAAKCTL